MTMEDVWSGPREEWSDIYIKWRAGYDRLAGLPGWIAIHAPLLFQADHRREVGATILGHHVVSARFCRCQGAVAIRFNERVSTDVIRDGQSKDDGARRSGVPLGLRVPGGELGRDNLT